MYRSSPDEPRLIAGLRAHDPHTLDALITEYSSDLLAFIRLILSGVGSDQDAEECMNDLFVAVWHEIAAFTVLHAPYSRGRYPQAPPLRHP